MSDPYAKYRASLNAELSELRATLEALPAGPGVEERMKRYELDAQVDALKGDLAETDPDRFCGFG